MSSPSKTAGNRTATATRTKTGRIRPKSSEHVVDQAPKKDPITGKPQIPGTASSRAGHQPNDNAAMRVRATRMLYYKLKRYSEGDVFTLADPDDFNSSAMAWEREMTPEARTTSQQAINRENVEVGRRKAAEAPGARAAGSNAVI